MVILKIGWTVAFWNISMNDSKTPFQTWKQINHFCTLSTVPGVKQTLDKCL